MALLSVRNVTRRFGGIVAIDDVSLDVEKGQIVGLIGPNGAGKTTLFNVITRLYKPDAGELEFAGKSLLHTPPHRIVRRGIARTFQNVELFRTMTVLANVLVGAHTRTKPFRSGAVRERAYEVLDYVGIADFANRPAAGLSFGTLKRVELARASSPQIVPVDATGAGDTFTACLVVSLLEGRPREDSLRRACAAGARAAARFGAQTSLPTAEEVDALL